MNIYIFGDESFKKQISKILEKSGIKYRLGELGTITEVDTVGFLKDAILRNPKDIYLIDHAKIIVKNFLSTKIKFLNPQDGIEKTFLEDHGIGDLSVDDVKDISKHILKKLDALEKENGVCDIDTSSVSSDLELEEDDYKVEEPKIAQTYVEEPKIVQTQNKIYKEEISFEEDNIGDVMGQLTQLDDISESDILDALSNIDGIKVSSQGDSVKVSSSNSQPTVKSNSVEVNASDLNDIAALLEQLKNNKTLEISIKIKN